MVGVHWLLHKLAVPLHQLGLTSWLYLNAQAGSRVVHNGLGTILAPVGSTGVIPNTLLPALGSKVISSKSLSKELALDPAPDLQLPGLALALVKDISSSANSTEAAKFCDKNSGYRAELTPNLPWG